MSRTQGDFNFSANFEVQKEGTIDARQFVDTFADLLNFTSANYIAQGFPVTVRNDSVYEGTPKPAGTYFCVDKDNLDQADSWKAETKGITNKAIYLGFFTEPANPPTINETTQGIIADALNTGPKRTILKGQNVKLFASITKNGTQTRVVAEIVNKAQNIIIGNDPDAFVLNPKNNISILSRSPLNAGTLTADANTQTIILNDDGNGNAQDIEPGHSTVEDYVIANGPFTVQPLEDGNTRFVVNIGGEIINYLYNGDTGDVGGTGNYAPVANDFVEVDPSTDVSTFRQAFLNKELAGSTIQVNSKSGVHYFADITSGNPVDISPFNIDELTVGAYAIIRSSTTAEPVVNNNADSKPVEKIGYTDFVLDELSGKVIDIIIEIKPFAVEVSYRYVKD